MIANEDLQEMKRELTLELANGKYEPLMKVLVLSTGRFVNKITRRANPIPMWYSATLLATLILIVDFSVSLLLNEADPIRIDQVAFEIMITIFVVLVVLALIKFHDDTKIRLNAVVVENIRLGDNLNDIRNWKGKVYDINLQIIVCIIYSIIAGAYTIGLLAFQSGTFVGFGPSIFYILSSFLTGTILYTLIMTGLFYARLGKYEYNLFSLDPTSSALIFRLARMQNGFVFVLALLIGLNNVVFAYFELLTIVQVIATWFPLALCFAVNQLALGEIILKAKLQTLNLLQEQIEKLYKKEEIPSKETLEQISKLMDLHERIKNTNNRSLTWQTFWGFINSSLLPFIGFFMGNLDSIVAMLR